MKDIPHDLIQKKGFTGLLGVTIAFIVSLLPLGTFTYFSPPHFWTQSETYMSIVLLIGTALLVVSEARHLRLCAQSEKRIPRTRSDIGSVVGSLLYFTIVGYMVLGAGDFPALHLLIYASAAIYYTNRLLLLYPSNAGESRSQEDWKHFASIFMVELFVFGTLLWFIYFLGD